MKSIEPPWGVLSTTRARSAATIESPNDLYFNEVDRGGHCAAWEQPTLFTAELRAAFGSLRSR
jgi:hypothetical protein